MLNAYRGRSYRLCLVAAALHISEGSEREGKVTGQRVLSVKVQIDWKQRDAGKDYVGSKEYNRLRALGWMAAHYRNQ